MSNAGQAVLDVAGLAIGFYIGGPSGAALGLTLASGAGSVLFPTQLPSGPKISDNRTTTASIGLPVSLVFGTADVAGTVIWLAPYVQSSHGGGKGGSQQQTYQYNQSIAIALCEGPIGGVSRIWENGTIVYDVRPQQAANADLFLVAETDQAFAARIYQSAQYAATFTLHLGDEEQLPDPTIEATQGFGQVPAFRGLAYIVYPHRLLQTAQGWRHPTFKFEVYKADAGVTYANSVWYMWNLANGIGPGIEPRDPRGTYQYSYVGPYLGYATYFIPVDGYDALSPIATIAPPYNTSLVAELASAKHSDGTPANLIDHVLCWSFNTGPTVWDETYVGGGVGWGGPPTVPGGQPAFLYFFYNSRPVTLKHYDGYSDVGPSPPDFCTFTRALSVDANGTFWWSGFGGSPELRGVYSPGAPVGADDFSKSVPCTGGGAIAVNIDAGVMVQQIPSPPPGPFVLDNQPYHALSAYNVYAPEGMPTTVVSMPFDPIRPVGHPDDNEAFWTAAYTAAVAAGGLNPYNYGSGGEVTFGSAGYTATPVAGDTTHYPMVQNYGYVSSYASAPGVTVRSIIETVCKRAGLSDSQVNASDLDAVSVAGYAVSAMSTGSTIIAPLRSVAFFDVVESQGVLKFVARGKPIVATLTSDDIGAYEAGSGKTATVPPSITTVRTQDEELPRSIRFKYKAVTRDYEDGEADSPFRLSTEAVNDIDVSSPVCLYDTQAAQCAEVLWANSWAGRTVYNIAVDQSWLALDCGDCIGVPVDNVIQRMRIVSETTAAAVLRKLSCVRDDGGAYISFAVASAPQRAPQLLTFIASPTYECLDLPALLDTDNNPGFYIAAQRQAGGGSWNGALAYQSVDGTTYTQLTFGLPIEATLGTLAAAVPNSAAWTWDTVTTITVNVPSNQTFESLTDAAVLAGANGIAIGADGRWEIVQFATATQVSSTQWTLSRLLRGRRGTEHIIGSSLAGDDVVLLSTGDLGRVVIQQSQIGALLDYKVAALGKSYASGVHQAFAAHAVALVPFSPVALKAVMSGSDILITWIRRGRLGRTLASGSDVPLSEATEAYQVDIYSAASPPTVVRTLSVTSQTATYSAAQVLADLGTSTPTSIHIAVYQISAVVGRGTPGIATLAL